MKMPVMYVDKLIKSYTMNVSVKGIKKLKIKILLAKGLIWLACKVLGTGVEFIND